MLLPLFLDSCMVELNSNGMPADEIFQVILNLCPGKGWTLEDIKTRYRTPYSHNGWGPV